MHMLIWVFDVRIYDKDQFVMFLLNVKNPVITVAENIFFSETLRPDIPCESIHMKCQALIFLKNNKEKQLSEYVVCYSSALAL